MNSNRLVRLDELSDLTGLPAKWLREESDAGRLPTLRAGRRRYFDPDEVRRLLAERSREETRSAEGKR
jgi:DNA-binding transcriptional MerR regulator